MTVTIGMSIDRTGAWAVVSRHARVIAEARVEGSSPAESAAVALERLGMTTRRARALHVAIGPGWSRTKVLTGLPALRAGDLEQLVRENGSRFFIMPVGGGHIAARSTRNGTVGECFDASVVAAVSQGLHGRLPLDIRFVSCASALAALVGDGTVTYTESDATYEMVFAGGRVAAVRTSHPDQARGADDRPRARDAAVGSILVKPADHPYWIVRARPAQVSRRRARVAAALACAAGVIALASPLAASWSQNRLSGMERRSIERAYRTARGMISSLNAVSASLEVIARFERHTPPPTLPLLASLTRALPADASLVALSADSAGLSVVTLSDRAVDVLAALDSCGAIVEPRLAGPIRPELVGGFTLERASFTARWSGRP